MFCTFSVTYGVNADNRTKIIKGFLRNIYNVQVEPILTAVMNEYTDYRQTDDENKIVNRDLILSIFRYYNKKRALFLSKQLYRNICVFIIIKLKGMCIHSFFSDARVAAPLIKSASLHREHGSGNTFLYVFQHVTKLGYFPEVR